jgi:hypothetical protein
VEKEEFIKNLGSTVSQNSVDKGAKFVPEKDEISDQIEEPR